MRQTCKTCGRPDYWNFDVPDDLWQQIVPENLRNRVVCAKKTEKAAVTAA
jgi:hypothetical protein